MIYVGAGKLVGGSSSPGEVGSAQGHVGRHTSRGRVLTGLQQAEARDAAKHPTAPGTATPQSRIRECSASNTSSAETEKVWGGRHSDRQGLGRDRGKACWPGSY